MTARSVKVTLDKEYDLRFEQDDVIACEDELKIGYVHFFKTTEIEEGRYIPTYLSLKLLRSLVHHGLKEKDNRGEFVYVLPQSSEGAKQAGNLIQQFKQKGGSDLDLWLKCRDAFADWFAAPDKSTAPKPAPAEGDIKNSPAGGSNRRHR